MGEQATDNPPVRLVTDNRVIIILGAGGVGKTTSAVTLAFLGARMGKRVGLLSIDPAKRLAAALGIGLGSRLSKVKIPAEFAVKGSIHAAMLDQKSVFDEMVRQFTASSQVVDKIFKNSIYKEVSTNLGGPLEYMALAKLQQMVDSPDFDLVILDTPPDAHAIDFLERPNILAGFMDKGVMTWLIKPFHLAQKMGMSKILTYGERLMGGIASVTGVSMLQKLSEFLVLMDDVIRGFHDAGKRITTTLHANDTALMIVAAPQSSCMRSSLKIATQLAHYNYPLDMLLINRYLPSYLQEAAGLWQSKQVAGGGLEAGFSALNRKAGISHDLTRQLAESVRSVAGQEVPVLVVEEQEQMVHSAAAVLEFSRILEKAPEFPEGETS